MTEKEEKQGCCGMDHPDRGCDCEEEMNDEDFYEADTLILTLEDDTEVECEIMDIFSFEGKDYIALLPEDDSSDSLLLYGYEETDDEEEAILSMIESKEEFDKVAEAYHQLLQSDMEEWDESDDDLDDQED